MKHGDLLTADQHLRRALDIREKAAPGSAAVANSLHNLGLVAAARGDLAAAEDFLQRSLALTQALAPDTLGASLYAAQPGRRGRAARRPARGGAATTPARSNTGAGTCR